MKEALRISDALQMTMSALRLSPLSEMQEWGSALEHLESRLFLVARVAEASGLVIPSCRIDPRAVLLPLLQRIFHDGYREGLHIKPKIMFQSGLLIKPYSMLLLGMLVYEILFGLPATPRMRTRCTGFKLVKEPCERTARLDISFENDLGRATYGTELFVAMNYLDLDLIHALAYQLGATMIIGSEASIQDGEECKASTGKESCDYGQEGSVRETLRIAGIRCV